MSNSRMSNLWHGVAPRTSLAAGIAAVLLALAVSPVAALQYEKVERYDVTDSWTYADECGFDVAVEARYWGTIATRAGTGPDASAFFVRNAYFWEEAHTRLPDGPTIVVGGHGLFNEVKATRIQGSVFEFSAINVGQPLTITDSSGRVVLRDRGAYRESILFDTLGDETPGGEFIGQTFFAVNGPHPSENLDWCALFE